MNIHVVLFAIVAAGLVYLLSQVAIYKGFRGAMFHARVARTVGELDLGKRRRTWRTARVHLLERREGLHRDVGIEFVSKAFGRSGIFVLALSPDQATALTGILSEAVVQADGRRLSA